MSSAMSARDRIMAGRNNIAANRSKGLRPYKFKAGVTKFRILPLSADKSLPFERKYGKTYLKSFDGKSFFGIVDRSITFDEPSDPIRELIFDAMRQAPDEDTKKHYQQMLAGTRYVFNALILDDKDQSPTEPVLLEMSEGAFDNILGQFMIWSEEDPDYDLAALDTGHVFTVEKTGAGLDTRYNFQVTPTKMALPTKILDKVIDLDTWILSQVEGLEVKALEFLGRVNGAVGITTTVNAGLIASSTAGAGSTAGGTSPKAVTTLIDEDVEDAVIEEVAAEIVAETVEVKVEEPAPVAVSDDADLEAILAQLNMG